MQEGSILLFKDVMEAAVWWQKRNMRKTVHRGLLPLLFQMSDETPSVAEVRISDLTSMQARVCWHLRGGLGIEGEFGKHSSSWDVCLWCHLPASVAL